MTFIFIKQSSNSTSLGGLLRELDDVHKVLGTVPLCGKHCSDVSYYDGKTPEEGAVGCNQGWERLQRRGHVKIGSWGRGEYWVLKPEENFTKGGG